MKNSIRTEIHTLLNNEKQRLNSDLEILKKVASTIQIEVGNKASERTAQSILKALEANTTASYTYTIDLIEYLEQHPLYKGRTDAIDKKWELVAKMYRNLTKAYKPQNPLIS